MTKFKQLASVSVSFLFLVLYSHSGSKARAEVVTDENAISGYTGPTCPDDWIAYKNEKCIKLFIGPKEEALSFDDAQQRCVKEHSNLASFHSEDELKTLADHIMSTQYHIGLMSEVWLGGRNINGSWTWIDNTPVDYMKWGIGFPDENPCMILISVSIGNTNTGNMASFSCKNLENYMCQKNQSEYSRVAGSNLKQEYDGVILEYYSSGETLTGNYVIQLLNFAFTLQFLLL